MNESPGKCELRFSRIWRGLILGGLICGTGLSFPAWTPLVFAVWVLLYLLLRFRFPSAWILLPVPVLIFFFRGICWIPGLAALAGVMITVSFLDGTGRLGKKVLTRGQIGAWGILLVAMGFMGIDWWKSIHPSHPPLKEADGPVVCIGDSLSSWGYVDVLQKRLSSEVVDLSAAGINLKEGLQLLPEIKDAKPSVVVIELGGHDYLEGRAKQEARADLEKMVLECQRAGAEVVLFEIPRGFFFDFYGGMERSLAREHDLELIPDTVIRQFVLRSRGGPLGGLLGPELSDDGMHPNAAGNELMADFVCRSLERMFEGGLQQKE